MPGDDDTRQNRLQGFGPLSGIAVRAGAGLVGQLLRRAGHDLPAPLAVLLISATAMALPDIPLVLLQRVVTSRVGVEVIRLGRVG